MIKYHKINSIFKRNPENHKLMIGDYSKVEYKYLENNEWEWTEKVDGTNIRVGWVPLKKLIEIRGRTDNAQLHIDLVEEIQRLFTIEKLDNIFPCSDVVFYGEGYGAGIQKGGKYSEKKRFLLFDIQINGYWQERKNVEGIADNMEILYVPVVGKGTLLEGVELIKRGLISKWGNFEAEGIVARPAKELFGRNMERIILKIKHKDFK